MAREAEKGILYFPMNADIVHNKKVKLVVAEFGPRAWSVLLPLYCKIYRENGYWIDWENQDDKILFASDECRLDVPFINEVVTGCVRRSLFDEEVFNMFGILTSDRIQLNYLEATKRRKKIELIKQFMVIKDDVYISSDNVNIIDLNVNTITKNVNISQQKEKEKEKKKESESKRAESSSTSKELLMDVKKTDFYEALKQYINKYPTEMLRAFYDYWTEPNKSMTKMRFELEKTWDFNRRLSRWAHNDRNFGNNQSDQPVKSEY